MSIYIVIAVLIFAVLAFVAGALVFRKHAARIEAAAKDITVAASAASNDINQAKAVVTKAASDVKSAVSHPPAQ